MARKEMIVALGLIVAAQPLAATQPDPAPVVAMPAPAGTPETKYCLRVGPLPGNIAERVECMTRAEWAEQDVDVDKEWAKEGVRVIG